MNAVPSSSPLSQDLARTLAADINNNEPVIEVTTQRIKAGIASTTGQVIDVTVHANNSGVAPVVSTLDESGLNQAEPARLANGSFAYARPEANESRTTSSALTTAKGSFSSFLAPLKQDTFKQVVTSVEGKLEVVNQTLSMLDDALSSQKFDAILDEMLRSITLKTGELLNADRTTIFILDEEKDELWSIVAKDERGNNLELRVPKTSALPEQWPPPNKPSTFPMIFMPIRDRKPRRNLIRRITTAPTPC